MEPDEAVDKTVDKAVDKAVMVAVVTEPIDTNDALTFVATPASGATCVFLGTVRDHSERGAVTAMRYEAWPELATQRLASVAAEMRTRWHVDRVAIIHRYGELAIGEASVVVAASAAHRAEAFEACRHGIERLKEEAPIWKLEELASGTSEWVMGS